MSKVLEFVEKLATAANKIGSDLLLISGAIIVVALIWGGIQYMNNPEAGKKTVIGALIGLAVVALSFLLMSLVTNAL